MSKGKSGYLIVTLLACLVVGAGIERVRRAVLAPEPPGQVLPEEARPLRPPQPGRAAAARTQDLALTTSLEALRLRVADLEAALAERDAELARLRQERPGAAAAPRRFGREEFRKRMEQLKKENAEPFAEREKRRENHEKLLATLAKIDALRAQRERAGAEPGGEADATFQQALRESLTELGTLYERERAYLLEQAAAAGYEGEDAAGFVDAIQQTIQSTTMQGFGPGAPGGPPPSMP